MRRLLIGLGVLVAVLLPSAPAWAHNVMVSASPAEGVTVASAPTAVSLKFLETLNKQYTTIVVQDAAQHSVAASAQVLDGHVGTVALRPDLANGTYTVAYRTVSLDGHVVSNSYKFTVDDPSKPPAPVAAAAAVTSSGGGGLSMPVLIGFVVVGVALVAAAAVVYLRSRRNYSPPAADH
jgi:hypothetical protein